MLVCPNVNGEEIKQKREAIGLSRLVLAYKANISQATVERIEQGKHKPQKSTLAMIEAALEAEEEATLA